MTAHFTATELAGDRFLVEGTDTRGITNQTVVSGWEWKTVNHNTAHDQALAEYDATIKEFFAPLTKAKARLNAAHETSEDPLLYVEVQEAIESTVGQPRKVVQLSHDSVILRAIAERKFDRLVWVGDSLEVTAGAATAPTAEDVEGPGDEDFRSAF